MSKRYAKFIRKCEQQYYKSPTLKVLRNPKEFKTLETFKI